MNERLQIVDDARGSAFISRLPTRIGSPLLFAKDTESGSLYDHRFARAAR